MKILQGVDCEKPWVLQGLKLARIPCLVSLVSLALKEIMQVAHALLMNVLIDTGDVCSQGFAW